MTSPVSGSFTEDESTQLIAQLLHFVGICCLAEAICNFKEGLFSFFSRLNTFFNEFDQDTVITKAAALGNAVYLFIDFMRQGHASSHLRGSFDGCHISPTYTVMVQPYSHSIVPGGFDVTSYTTRLIPFTSF